MTSETQGKIMSEYTPLNELTQQEQVTYLSNAAVTTFGKTSTGGKNTNVNIPLSTLVPSVPVTDVTVNGSSVVSNGVAAVTVPTATDLAGDGLSVNGSTGKLDVSNKVPAPTATTDRGKVLTVNSSDEVVWATPAAPSVSIDGDSIINGANGLEVNTGMGLQIGSGAVMTRLAANGGLDYDDNEGARGIKVVAGTGVTLDSTGGVGLDFTGADNGDVLSCVKTVEDGTTTYGINWVAPGGGGGSPYTKVSVTPSAPYEDPADSGDYSQDIEISNNTYSVSSPLCDTGEEYGTELIYAKIKLPANTDFPMAVVEFDVANKSASSVKRIKVYVGSTELTRLYSAPYNKNIVVSEPYDNTRTSIYLEAGSPTYMQQCNYYMGNMYTLSHWGGIGQNTKVQVHIFGNCFRVETSNSTIVGS